MGTTAMKTECNDKEKVGLTPRCTTAEYIVRQLLDGGFKAQIHSIREGADGTERWRITLSKKP